MSRWTGGRGPLRTLAARIGGAPGPDDFGPVLLLAPQAYDSADLAAAVEALRHEDRSHATVLVPAGFEGSRVLWRQLTPALNDFRKSGITTVRLVWAGAAADQPGRPAPARRIRDDWQLEVVAPAGPVVISPGGSLFVPSGSGGTGGWWRFAPGVAPRPLGLRHPVPSWEDAAAHLLSGAIEGHVVESVPAGVLIRRAVPLPDPAPSVGASIPVDEHRLAVVVGIPGTPPVATGAVTQLLTRMTPRARSTARLVPGDGRDLLAAGQQTANLLGTEVEVVSGLPALLESATGTPAEEAVVLIGPDGEPSWRAYAETVACRPARDGRAPAPRIVQWRSPVPGSRGAPESGASPLDDQWQVAVTRAGLWVGPREGVRPGAFGWVLDPATMVVDVGEPGQRLDDEVWQVLDTLLDRLEPSAIERTTLHVRGGCTAHGGRQVRRLADRRGLSLVFEEEPSTDRGGEDAGERAAAPAGTRVESTPEVPWHASPMSVRIRHVAALSPSASGGAAASAAAAPAGVRAVAAASAPVGRSASSSARAAGPASPAPAWAGGPASFAAGRPGGFSATVVGSGLSGAPGTGSPAVVSSRPGGGPDTSAATGADRPRPSAAPAVRTGTSHASAAGAGVPPGFAEAFAASRPPVGPSQPPVPRAEPANEPEPAPADPVVPAVAPPVPPVPAPEPPVTPVPATALPVRVGPLQRSTPADQQALRALAGEQWWQQKASVARTLTVMPGLRGHDENDAVLADLTAVRSFLTLDDAPTGWRWLERQLAAGSADAYPSLVGLASGLRRLPSYRGVVVRGAGVLPAEARAVPAGRELCHAGPVAAYVLEGAPATAGDRYLIWSTTGRRVRILTGGASRAERGEEVVFGPGTRFQVLGTRSEHGATTVLLREVASGGAPTGAGGEVASDEGVREQLVRAAARFPLAEGAAPWPPRFSGTLPERGPHGDGNA